MSQKKDNRKTDSSKAASQAPRPLRSSGSPAVGMHSIGGRFANDQKPKNMKKTIKRLWTIFGTERWKLMIIFFIATCASGVGLIGPWLIGRAVDAIDSAGGAVDFTSLQRILILLAIAYAAGAALILVQEWWIAGVAQRGIKLIRRALFDRLQKLPLKFFDTHTHGELMSRLANDVDNVSMMVSSSTTQLFSSVLMVTGSLGMMLYLSPVLTLLTLITVPLTLGLSSQIAKRSRKAFREQQIQLADLNGHIEEILSGQEVVKAFSQEKHVISQFDLVNANLRQAGMRAQLLSGTVMPMLNVITNIGFVIVATAGGFLAVGGIISIGVIASFINYARQFARPLNDIANLYSNIQSAQASAERIFELMDETPEPVDETGAEALISSAGEVTFEAVDFGYLSNVPVLEGVNIKAEPGKTIALVGPTGAGKTTVVNLLVRFYDPVSGTIKIDQKNMKQWTRSSVRSSFGMVLQDTHLFSSTVRENIRYGRLDATDEEIVEAATAVGADDFIQRLPEGYDTKLDESGGGFSQGQRQLLAIARAVLAQPAILILDEATSSVDTRTEMVLQKAMMRLREGRTSFIIAHRLSTIRDADEILVIDQGRIIERGSHQQLMQQEGFYHDLYSGQFALLDDTSQN